MPDQVEWLNEREWGESLVRVFNQWKTNFVANAEKLAELAEREAKSRAPVRTGRLRDGCVGRMEETEMSVSAILQNEVPYAGFIEFGTRHMRARPFMRPGYAAAQNAYDKIMVEGCE
jgi:HK97 gp10 family phage protein